MFEVWNRIFSLESLINEQQQISGGKTPGVEIGNNRRDINDEAWEGTFSESNKEGNEQNINAQSIFS